MVNPKKFWNDYNWQPFFLWSIIIIILSSISSERVSDFNLIKINGIDKIAHFVMYFIQSFLLIRWLTAINISSKIKRIMTILIAGMFGVFMELMQFFYFTSRNFEIPDIIANIIGAFVGMYIYLLIENKNI